MKRPPDSGPFWAKVRKTDGCWLWTAGTDKDGYGQYGMRGHGNWRCHRLAYLYAHGHLPTLLRHTCNVRVCCNPDHLVPGTPADNVADRDRAGRTHTDGPVVDQHGRVYRCRFEAAKALGLDSSHVSKVLRGKLHSTGGYRFAPFTGAQP